uniref:Uncharacterized protein n=1 Tax=Amphimedon queenslandica TaxID=400682 RepID=A0A1X7UVU5_AMPQE
MHVLYCTACIYVSLNFYKICIPVKLITVKIFRYKVHGHVFNIFLILLG